MSSIYENQKKVLILISISVLLLVGCSDDDSCRRKLTLSETLAQDLADGTKAYFTRNGAAATAPIQEGDKAYGDAGATTPLKDGDHILSDSTLFTVSDGSIDKISKLLKVVDAIRSTRV